MTGRLPTFLVIGAMKAGTTSLWRDLRAHPQVFMPDVKEIHFFSNPDRYERGFDWYRAHFADAGDTVAVGEASTNYTKHPRRPDAAARVAAAIPDVRLVYAVRDPIERIRSHYLHVAHGHGERRPLSVAVWEDPEYLDVSRYRTQIDRYLEHFDRSQLLVITAEALARDRRATLGRVLAFVGVDPSAAPRPRGDAQVNRSAEKRLDTAVSSTARRMPGYRLARHLVPRRIRRVVGRVTKRPVTTAVDVTVPDDLRRALERELHDEVAGLRPFLGPSFDGWGIG
jgi:hypothetical protein